MSSLGRFLEISIPAEDVEDSLSFYRRLGFFELPVGEIRAYNYAVVSDGSVCLGLHADGVDQLSLSFVKPNIARHSRTFRDLGLELEFERLADDEFNEAAVADPDGHQAFLLEARTFRRHRWKSTIYRWLVPYIASALAVRTWNRRSSSGNYWVLNSRMRVRDAGFVSRCPDCAWNCGKKIGGGHRC